ncbi:helix-turn-helix domain-containing protein [Paenibacillus taichungensis]
MNNVKKIKQKETITPDQLLELSPAGRDYFRSLWVMEDGDRFITFDRGTFSQTVEVVYDDNEYQVVDRNGKRVGGFGSAEGLMFPLPSRGQLMDFLHADTVGFNHEGCIYFVKYWVLNEPSYHEGTMDQDHLCDVLWDACKKKIDHLLDFQRSKLANIREEFHLTIPYVAQTCGVSEEELKSIECGEALPSEGVTYMLSKIFGVKPRYFFKPEPTDVEKVMAFQEEISKRVLGPSEIE